MNGTVGPMMARRDVGSGSGPPWRREGTGTLGPAMARIRPRKAPAIELTLVVVLALAVWAAVGRTPAAGLARSLPATDAALAGSVGSVGSSGSFLAARPVRGVGSVAAEGPGSGADTSEETGIGNQSATSDGTAPYKVLSVGLVSLAVLMGILTWFYWKATVPPARRGYLPPPDQG